MLKNTLTILFITSFFLLGSCQEPVIEPTQVCTVPPSTVNHPKAALFQGVIDKYVQAGLPGIAVLVRDGNGTWVGSGGKADIQKNIPLLPCHVSKTASLTKIFIAALALKLVEEGVLQLDEKITKWIPEGITSNIKNADVVTLRQLLNHTSGIYDFSNNDNFYLALLNYPTKKWKQEELLEFSYNQDPVFAAGTSSGYSNTSTVLATMVIEAATKRNHAALLREKILNQLGLSDSYYYWQEALPSHGVAQGYFDLYNNNTLVNVSSYNTGTGNGLNGLYSTVYDLQKFIDALLRNKTLLSQSSINTMLTFDDLIENRKYLGLGLFKDYIDGNFKENEFGYGHRGRDLGYSADMFYFPNQDITVTLLVNYGTNAKSNLQYTFTNFRYDIADVAIH
ncbi:serine hydrolase domain-containing protein [Adhaeribacter radiodurans]|uniref:Beta-lactamase family protein n=1 Tax=Adhaeribacter radiodurans TaxID=2745197 RepID=A0A7L7LAN5_9BACT|nr:serine hydrolase domain-containing protein [Adhaeribacter radiodurans]QMU29898.1 beta-lactamase family protein [Adhaeribacter radiodurans]